MTTRAAEACTPSVVPAEVEAALMRFLADNEPDPTDVKRIARRHHALPLLLDMGGCIALRPSGELIGFLWDSPDELSVESNTQMCHVARAVGTRRYPEISGLAPVRTPQSRTCPACKGTGSIRPDLPNVVCSCGGLGWVP
jgi:hypothetical protein